MSLPPACPRLDLRMLRPTDQPQAVLGLFQHLPQDEVLELLTDQPTQGPQQRLHALWPGQLSWLELEDGTGLRHVRIHRPSAGTGCGGCACGR